MAAPDPLDSARSALERIHQFAERAADDPIAAMVHRLGDRTEAVIKLAVAAALVSIAADMRRLADRLAAEPDDFATAIRRAARAMSTADLQCMYQEGRILGGVWPSIMAAVGDVLAERGESPDHQEA